LGTKFVASPEKFNFNVHHNEWKDIVRKLFFILLFFTGLNAMAQEGLTPLMPETDSTQLAAERQMMYHKLLNGSPENDLFAQPIHLPNFDFKSELEQRWNYGLPLSLNSEFFNNFSPGYFGYVSPALFLRNGSVFSQGQYQLSDKFKVGGFSYSGNSIFAAPLPSHGLNNFDTHGATMFMQYKVSKNFKIETRVSVQQGPGPKF